MLLLPNLIKVKFTKIVLQNLLLLKWLEKNLKRHWAEKSVFLELEARRLRLKWKNFLE
jgi:hypothetical protein